MRRPHPIEVESYRILRSRVDTTHLPPLTRAVVERVVHTTADTTWTGDIVADESALAAGRAALLAGAPIVVDVRMVAAGITSRSAIIALDLANDELTTDRSTRATPRVAGNDGVEAGVAGGELTDGGSTRAAGNVAGGGAGGVGAGGLVGGELAGGGSSRGGDAGGDGAADRAGGELAGERSTREGGNAAGGRGVGAGSLGGSELAGGGSTRAAAGVRVAARRWPVGAVWVIGNAPTALVELVTLAGLGVVRPALVVGMPVGFVGAVAAKAALRASGLPAVSSTTERGGAAVAAATVNALLYAEAANA